MPQSGDIFRYCRELLRKPNSETRTTRLRRSRLRRTFNPVVSILLVSVAALWVVYRVKAQGPLPLPSATVKIWDAIGAGLGTNPGQSNADFLGVTAQVATAASPLSIVTLYDNTICPDGPAGITFWNPVTNVFKCFGLTGGSFLADSAVNLKAPVKTATSPSAATFQPGDVWV